MINWILAGFVVSTCVGFWVLAFLQMRQNAVTWNRIDNLHSLVLRKMGCLIDWEPESQRKRGDVMTELIHREADIIQWGEDRHIFDRATALSQMSKLLEEACELYIAVAMQDKDGIMDGVGDLGVCSDIQAEFAGLSQAICREHAWNQIKDRKGEMRNGIFVKESDLAAAPPHTETPTDRKLTPKDARDQLRKTLESVLIRVYGDLAREGD